MSSTTAQLDANRANAQLSTGPKTDAGKQRAALNHVTHGFTGQTLVLSAAEKDAYQAFNDSSLKELAPIGPTESMLVRRLIDNQYRVTQIHTTESGIYALGPIEYADQCENHDPATALALCRALTLRNHRADLDRLHRYERTLMRQVEKDKAELSQLQQARKAEAARQMDEAVVLAAWHEYKELPFDPAKFGFELSAAEILAYAERADILDQARNTHYA